MKCISYNLKVFRLLAGSSKLNANLSQSFSHLCLPRLLNVFVIRNVRHLNSVVLLTFVGWVVKKERGRQKQSQEVRHFVINMKCV